MSTQTIAPEAEIAIAAAVLVTMSDCMQLLISFLKTGGEQHLHNNDCVNCDLRMHLQLWLLHAVN